MNKLKWAIFKKRQLYNSYISNKSQKNWEISGNKETMP